MTSVKEINYSMTVELPMHRPLSILNGMTLPLWVKKFETLKGLETSQKNKNNFERCILVLKYAKSHFGILTAVSNQDYAVQLTFTFSSLHALMCFEEGLRDEVNVFDHEAIAN